MRALSMDEMFRIVEDVFSRQLAQSFTRPASVVWAAGALRTAHGRVPVSALRDESGLSHRHFIAKFRDEIGMPPKLYGRICRLQSVLQQLIHAVHVDWADVAAASGFYDQAHFIRDF